MSPRDDDRSARQIARSKQRNQGDQSARIASALMKLRGTMLAKLVIEDDLREEIDRARAVTTHIARRRAERALAGELRRYDLSEIAAAIENAEGTSHASTQQFHLAERWRTRLIEEGAAALAEFPGGGDERLPGLVEAAQRERTTGLPRGAARALFRHVVELLKAPGKPDSE